MGMDKKREIVWFSCGAASACAAKLATEKYKEDLEIIYCDTLAYEHPDNIRFLRDVENWLGVEIKILKSKKYADIYDVFDKTGWLVGPGGARCTTELKKVVRKDYQRVDDVHIFGLTVDEKTRINRLEHNNFELTFDWILRDNAITKQKCFDMLYKANIETPAMYKLGYKNNNCIGCVKGRAGYWNKIRVDFPEAFNKMALQERKMNVSIHRKNGKKVFLDELPPTMGNYLSEIDFECGSLCQMEMEL